MRFEIVPAKTSAIEIFSVFVLSHFFETIKYINKSDAKDEVIINTTLFPSNIEKATPVFKVLSNHNKLPMIDLAGVP